MVKYIKMVWTPPQITYRVTLTCARPQDLEGVEDALFEVSHGEMFITYADQALYLESNILAESSIEAVQLVLNRIKKSGLDLDLTHLQVFTCYQN